MLRFFIYIRRLFFACHQNYMYIMSSKYTQLKGQTKSQIIQLKWKYNIHIQSLTMRFQKNYF